MEKDIRDAFTFRIKKSRHKKLKEICARNKVSHCKIIEILIEKFMRGEIIILPKDFDI